MQRLIDLQLLSVVASPIHVVPPCQLVLQQTGADELGIAFLTMIRDATRNMVIFVVCHGGLLGLTIIGMCAIGAGIIGMLVSAFRCPLLDGAHRNHCHR